MTKGYLPVYVCFLFFKMPSIYSLPPTQALASPAGHRPVCAWPRLRDAIVSMLKWLLLVVSSNGDCWRTPTHLCALMIWLIMKLVYARRASMRDCDCSPCQSALNYSKESKDPSSTDFSSCVSSVWVRCSLLCCGPQWWRKGSGSGRIWRVNGQRLDKDKGRRWDKDAGECSPPALSLKS